DWEREGEATPVGYEVRVQCKFDRSVSGSRCSCFQNGGCSLGNYCQPFETTCGTKNYGDPILWKYIVWPPGGGAPFQGENPQPSCMNVGSTKRMSPYSEFCPWATGCLFFTASCN